MTTELVRRLIEASENSQQRTSGSDIFYEAADRMNYLEQQFDDIVDICGIGKKTATGSIILTNVRNASRRADCLSLIEYHLSEKKIDENGKEKVESLLNWDENPDKYIETFKQAIGNKIWTKKQ